MADKLKTKSKITLIEKKYKDNSTEYSEEVILDDKEVAEIFNKFFANIVPNLNITASHNCNKDFQKTNDPVLNSINKYKYIPSIFMIKSKIEPQSKFSFTSVQYEDVLRKIKSLNASKASQHRDIPTKASQQSDIPTKILIENCEYFACYFHESINHCLDRSLLFPLDLKLASVAPVYKKQSKHSADNYRPVSTHSNTSKIYERCICDQIHSYFDKILPNRQCEFHKDYNAQHVLIA